MDRRTKLVPTDPSCRCPAEALLINIFFRQPRKHSPMMHPIGETRRPTTRPGGPRGWTINKPSCRPTGPRRSPNSAWAWKWGRTQGLSWCTDNPRHCSHSSLMGSTGLRHSGGNSGNLWSRARPFRRIATWRASTAKKPESASLEITKMIASLRTRLLVLERRCHIAAGTTPEYIQTMEKQVYMPWAIYLYSNAVRVDRVSRITSGNLWSRVLPFTEMNCVKQGITQAWVRTSFIQTFRSTTLVWAPCGFAWRSGFDPCLFSHDVTSSARYRASTWRTGYLTLVLPSSRTWPCHGQRLSPWLVRIARAHTVMG